MVLYDFTEYINSGRTNSINGKCKSGQLLNDDPDIFRKEYPLYVQKRALCFILVYSVPEEWKYVLQKYNVSIKIFKQIGQFKRLTVKYIIQNKKRWKL